MNRRGFTLLELMVVVAMTGILASVAVPSFQKYIKRSKTSEALTNIRKIYDGELVYYQEEHVDSSGAALPKQFVFASCQPSTHPGVKKQIANWDALGWSWIHFSSDSPVYYSYLVEILPKPTPAPFLPGWVPPYGVDDSGVVLGFLVRAFGDLDGDDQLSEFSRGAGMKAGETELDTMSGIIALDELE